MESWLNNPDYKKMEDKLTTNYTNDNSDKAEKIVKVLQEIDKDWAKIDKQFDKANK